MASPSWPPRVHTRLPGPRAVRRARPHVWSASCLLYSSGYLRKTRSSQDSRGMPNALANFEKVGIPALVCLPQVLSSETSGEPLSSHPINTDRIQNAQSVCVRIKPFWCEETPSGFLMALGIAHRPSKTIRDLCSVRHITDQSSSHPSVFATPISY